MLTDNNSVPPWGIDHQELSPEAAEDVAVRLFLDRDPVALACHRIGLESRSLPKPSRLHPDDVALIARQVAVELQLGEQTAQMARVAQKSPQRYTGTALGDRVASGRENDPYLIHTHEELVDIEKKQEGRAA